MVERYEELRDLALSRQRSSWSLGLALFLRRGMAAWMNAWKDWLPPKRPAPDKEILTRTKIPDGIQEHIIMGLVSMAINGRGEVWL
ncbi:MAG: hypothetical protein DRP37_07595 [Thermodesulfobacteriota bacterium]|nr:MAG: hypothetical protein DRP37_07595 [Thermodesulfobacteriota bacterium]HDN00125.1 hypothetical protein [Deltaproteobacteria bacterium]